MTNLHLKCNNCNIRITINPDDQISLFFVEHYGQKDKVTGRVFELTCPLCIGILEKIDENDDVRKHPNVPKHPAFIHTQSKQPNKQLK